MRITGLSAALVLPLVLGACSLNSLVFHTKSSEGTFTTLKQIALHKAPLLLKPLAWSMVRSPYNSLESISKLSMPKLIVHSRDDAVVPVKMAKELYRRAAEPREYWEISGAHCLGLIEHSRDYVARLNELVAQPQAAQ